MDSKKEPGNFADKKREEKGRGVIVAGPDAHENEKSGKAPSGNAENLHGQSRFRLRTGDRQAPLQSLEM